MAYLRLDQHLVAVAPCLGNPKAIELLADALDLDQRQALPKLALQRLHLHE